MCVAFDNDRWEDSLFAQMGQEEEEISEDEENNDQDPMDDDPPPLKVKTYKETITLLEDAHA